MQADLGLHCPLKESMDTVVYDDEQRMPRSDCMDAHVDLDLPCLHDIRALFPYCAWSG